MKIGIDAKRAIFNESGLGNYSRTLIHSLQTYYAKNNYILYYPYPTSDAAKKRVVEMKAFSRVIPNSWFSKKFSSLWRSYFIKKQITPKIIDIYHGLSHELPSGIKNTGVKSVVTIHDLIFKSHPHLYNALDVYAYDYKCKRACLDADLIVSVSENTKKEIVDLYKIPPEKIRVVYQAVNPIFEKTVLAKDSKNLRNKFALKKDYILYVGSLNERKNIKNLIKAFSFLKNRSEELVIVGRGEKHKKELITLVNELNIEEEVRFLSNVEDDELPAMYKNAKLFVYPSIYEGFGIPIIESLFVGTPVLVSKEPIFKEAGGPGAYYTDVTDPLKLSSSMKKLLKDSALRTELTKAGKLHMKNFTSKACAKNMIEAYKSLEHD